MSDFSKTLHPAPLFSAAKVAPLYNSLFFSGDFHYLYTLIVFSYIIGG